MCSGLAFEAVWPKRKSDLINPPYAHTPKNVITTTNISFKTQLFGSSSSSHRESNWTFFQLMALFQCFRGLVSSTVYNCTADWGFAAVKKRKQICHSAEVCTRQNTRQTSHTFTLAQRLQLHKTFIALTCSITDRKKLFMLIIQVTHSLKRWTTLFPV